MKTFREFIVIAEDRMGERLGKMTDPDFEQFLKGRTPGEAKTYREKRAQFRTTKVSGEDIRGSRKTQTPPKQPTQTPPKATQTPPRSTQTPPKQSSSTPPPKTPTGGLSTQTKPPTPKGPGLRARLGKLAGPATNVAAGALEYKARREAGQSRQKAAGGAVASGAGWAAGARIGAMVPGPVPVKLAAAGLGGLVGGETASKAYDTAASATRPTRQAISRATGFDKFQQKSALAKQGSGLQKAQQTVDTRAARQVSSKAGTYGATKGSAVTGIGGNTFTSRGKGGSAFMTTGAGGQRKTVQLAKTQLVRDPKTGQQRVGDLAFKGGKPVYLARPSVSSRDTSVTARIGRALNIGRYSKAAETQAAKQEYRTALKNTQQYQKKLGITPQAAKKQKLPGR